MTQDNPTAEHRYYVAPTNCPICGSKLEWGKEYENYGTFLTVSMKSSCKKGGHKYSCQEVYEKTIHSFDGEIVELEHCWPGFKGTEEQRRYVEEEYNEITRQQEKKFLETIELLKTKYQYKA